MKFIKLASAAIISFAASTAVNAQIIDIQITNLTHGQSFTPRLVIAHDDSVDTFEAGVEATRGLAWLAEAGVIEDSQNAASAGSNFQAELGGAVRPADGQAVNPDNTWRRFGGLLPPGEIRTYANFNTMGFEFLSVLAMLIPTNDAFLGLDGIRIPTEPGTYSFNINAYDAGTELNDELSTVDAGGNAIPGRGGYALPGVAGVGSGLNLTGTDGTGVAAQVDGSGNVPNGTDGPVHIHRNVLGDTQNTAGASDLDSTVHRWLNPVARITITVQP